MYFEWDEQKNLINQRKHGFDFADAWEIFEFPMIINLDERVDYGEDRWLGIGSLRNRIVVVIFTELDENTIRISLSEKRLNTSVNNMNDSSKTDWARIDAMTDQEIDTSDIPPLDESFFATGKLRMPTRAAQKVSVTINVDAEVLEWFKSQGADFQTRMSAALWLYAKAHQPTST
jgi:uncharacterized DUF497 family protein